MTQTSAGPLQALRRLEPQLVRLLALYLTMKVSLVLVGLLGAQLLPFNWGLYRTNLLLDIQQLPDWMRTFNTWDAQHYVFLAENGYGVNPMSNAFYPLYPYLVWMLSPLVGGHPLIAAWLVANGVSLLVPYFMYKLCRTFLDADRSFRSAALLVSFPTAFYLSVAYTEALYLAVCLASFYYLVTKDVLRASICCFLFPLVRAQALLFMLPIGVLFLESVLRPDARGQRATIPQALRVYAPPALATMAGMAAYFILCKITLGGYLAGLNAQGLYVANNSLGNLLKPLDWLHRNFLDATLVLHGYNDSYMDRTAFILCAPLLIGVALTQRPALFAYAAVTLLIPALAGSFMSYMRMLLVVFPLCIFIGSRKWPTEYLAVPMFTLQVLFYLMHTGGYWVA